MFYSAISDAMTVYHYSLCHKRQDMVSCLIFLYLLFWIFYNIFKLFISVFVRLFFIFLKIVSYLFSLVSDSNPFCSKGCEGSRFNNKEKKQHHINNDRVMFFFFVEFDAANKNALFSIISFCSGSTKQGNE